MITPNPKTSGGARWNYLAAWGYAWNTYGHDEAKARDFIAALYKNVPVLDSGARGATTTFVERGLGDVLLSWENEAYLAVKEFGADKFEIVNPSSQHSGRAARRCCRRVCRPARNAQGRRSVPAISCTPIRARRSPRRTSTGRDRRQCSAKYKNQFPDIKLFTITDVAGPWKEVQPKHFADHGVFDQLYNRKAELACARPIVATYGSTASFRGSA